MREDSLQQLAKTAPPSPLKFEAKSLFRNILATSPYSSRLCRHRLISTLRKWKQTRILRRRHQKKCEGIYPTQTLPCQPPPCFSHPNCAHSSTRRRSRWEEN